ncbi:hypothetical protein tpqmel_0664 [Candidatus Gastranaerophilus sp. (ex Termes propinquus)]|nr:hypothetical protein tpqmel_0664 [Candidatus Gastranaerophilus sp. (ex Termes propinquus)]
MEKENLNSQNVPDEDTLSESTPVVYDLSASMFVQDISEEQLENGLEIQSENETDKPLANEAEVPEEETPEEEAPAVFFEDRSQVSSEVIVESESGSETPLLSELSPEDALRDEPPPSDGTSWFSQMPSEEDSEDVLVPVEEAGLSGGYQEVSGGLDIQVPQDEAPVQKSAPKEPVPEQRWDDPFASIDAGVAVKKYIIYISRDFVDTLDLLDIDARNAYVNDALQLKYEIEKKSAKIEKFKRAVKHVAIVATTLVVGVPLTFFIINKSIDLTIANYSYIQTSFENLYRERAEKSKALRKLQKQVDK